MAAPPRRVGQRCAGVAHTQGVYLSNLWSTLSLLDLGNSCSRLIYLVTECLGSWNNAPGDSPGLCLRVLFCATSADLAARSSSVSCTAHIRLIRKCFLFVLRIVLGWMEWTYRAFMAGRRPLSAPLRATASRTIAWITWLTTISSISRQVGWTSPK